MNDEELKKELEDIHWDIDRLRYDLKRVIQTLVSLDDAFNKWDGYPGIIRNELTKIEDYPEGM